jgi:site-specific DNA recombinase
MLEALQSDTTKPEATSIIRSLLTEIRLIPQDGVLAIELLGALAGLLSLGTPRNDESHPRVASSCSTLLVAGVGFEPTTFRL